LVVGVLPKHSVVFAELYPATKKEEKFPIKLHFVKKQKTKTNGRMCSGHCCDRFHLNYTET
jgi:hypothetical protein